jgi:sugar transferase (PEP-CTERM/EpsH1 system associated)
MKGSAGRAGVKILWVKAGGLVPLDSGGKIRSYNILKELGRRHQVTFFSFHPVQEDAAHRELDGMFHRVVSCPLNLPGPKSFSELLEYGAAVFSPQPYAISKYCRPQVSAELRKLVAGESFDVIICDFLVAAGVIPWETTVPKVLFTHNVEAMIWKRHYEIARNPLWKALSWREWKTMARAERVYLAKADRVLAVSQTDCEAFAEFLPRNKLSVIPTGVDIEYFRPSAAAEQENTVVFTGSMDWMPNEDGIFYFAEHVLPLIRAEIPTVKLIVVGRKPSRKMQELAARDPAHIRLTGWVEDVRPHVATGAACIVPLRVGSGTRLKIFEAMAMGKAVVSTTVGAEGLPGRHGMELLLADSPEDFAACTLQLLRDRQMRRRIGSAARELVESKYSWAAVAEQFARTLEQAAANPE